MSDDDLLPRFDAERLGESLSVLSMRKQLSFALSCCERLAHNYRMFVAETKWGESTWLRATLDRLWTLVGSHNLDPSEIERLRTRCEACIPAADDFESLYVSSAQDACFAVWHVLHGLQEKSVSDVVLAASFGIDSVDLYVQEVETMVPGSRDIERRILEHPLMQVELRRQREAIQQLAELDEGSEGQWEAFEKRWRNPSSGCLDATDV